MIAVVVLALLIAAAVVLFAPKRYAATLVAVPANLQSSAGSLSSLSSAAGQLGGLASLAGISLSSSGSEKAENLAILQSEALTERFIAENNLLPVIFFRKWDGNAGKWKNPDPEKQPTLWKANKYFSENVRDVRENSKTGLVTLTINWRDPRVAADWANALVKMTNNYARARALDLSEKYIAYLNTQLGKTNEVELRNSIYALMQAEIKKQMIAKGSDEYALRVVDPAVAPEKPVFPRPLQMFSLGGVGGILLAIALVLLRYRWRESA